jgi:hypothetical protein
MTYTYTTNNTIPNGGLTSSHTIGGLTSTPSLNTITISGAGVGGAGAGQIYTTNGAGVLNWANTSSPYDTVMKINQTNPPELEVKGRMVINGRDLEERLDTIEKVLQIPERDVKLEKKHPKLKKLYDEYINALGKYRTFEAIKGEDE